MRLAGIAATVVAVGVVAAFAFPAAAQVSLDDVSLCRERNGDALARRASCTRLIETSGATGLDLARLYGGRGEALAVIVAQKKDPAAGYDDALNDFRRMAALDPRRSLSLEWGTYAYTLLFRATELRKAGRVAEAIPYLNEGLAHRPRETLFLNHRGLTYKDLGRLDEALADFQAAVAAKPDEAAGLNNRAAILQARAGGAGQQMAPFAEWSRCTGEQPDAAAAEAACTAVIDGGMQYDKWLSKALGQRGIWRIEQGRMPLARTDLDRALKLWPENVAALVYSGRWHKDRNDPQRGLAELDKAIALEPQNATVLSVRGTVLADLGRYQDAIQAYDTALRIGGKDEVTRSNRRFAQLALDNQRASDPRNQAQGEALGRLLTGAFTAAVGGNSTQVAQALSGQQVTAAPASSGESSRGSIGNENKCLKAERFYDQLAVKNYCPYPLKIVYSVNGVPSNAWDDIDGAAGYSVGYATGGTPIRGGDAIYLACRYGFNNLGPPRSCRSR